MSGVSASAIEGFRKNLEATLPELAKDLEAKITKSESQLTDYKTDLLLIERIAAAAQIDIKRKKPGDDVAPEKPPLALERTG